MMPLCVRGVVFRKGLVIHSFANLDPIAAETFQIDIPVQAGDVVYVLDDELPMEEFDIIRREAMNGHFSEDDVRAITTALYEVVAPAPALAEGEVLRWVRTGRQDWGQFVVSQATLSPATELLIRARSRRDQRPPAVTPVLDAIPVPPRRPPVISPSPRPGRPPFLEVAPEVTPEEPTRRGMAPTATFRCPHEGCDSLVEIWTSGDGSKIDEMRGSCPHVSAWQAQNPVLQKDESQQSTCPENATVVARNMTPEST